MGWVGRKGRLAVRNDAVLLEWVVVVGVHGVVVVVGMHLYHTLGMQSRRTARGAAWPMGRW
jgi:hypothetical protein